MVKEIVTNSKTGKTLEIDVAEDASDGAVLHAINKVRRTTNYELFKEIETELIGLGLKKENDYHYTFVVDGKKGQYWPSSSKWQHGRVRHGTPRSFLNWLKRWSKS